MNRSALLILASGVWPSLPLYAACLTNSDTVIYAQASYVSKQPPVWQIDGKNPYAANNAFNDVAMNYRNDCTLVEDKLDVDFSLLGLAYYPYKSPGAFEKDDHRLRALIDKLRLSYTPTESLRLDIGKLRPKGGAFYLKSPASLLSNYNAGFKATRINSPDIKPLYTDAFWGAELAQDTLAYSLSLTAAPRLTQPGPRYESSGNWNALARSNASDRYLLTYTDYRFGDSTPSVSLMTGEKKSVAIAQTLNVTPQFILSTELAYHFQQQWRHLDENSARDVEHYRFPDSLYSAKDDDGVELALGMQYTTDRFSQFGLEYYFQSEGYSSAQWEKQTDLIKFLNQRTNYAPLDRAFDAYKYLMASEIYNASSQGNLLGKHYLNAYGSYLMDDQSSVQPFAVMNLQDKSATVGLNINKPLNPRLELYGGLYTAFGKSDSEFALFGETLGTYLGFKYHL